MIDHESDLVVSRHLRFENGLFERFYLDHLGDDITLGVLVLNDEVWNIITNFIFDRVKILYTKFFGSPCYHVGISITKTHKSKFPRGQESNLSDISEILFGKLRGE
jgi:hypothetical protein